jgi:ribosomal-protein-alanine N-acetyltransferase
MKYISSGEPWADERVLQFVLRQIEMETDRGFCLWKVLVKGETEVSGYCGLQPLDDLPGIEIGWWLRPEFWDKGLATEAARAVLAEGFGPLGLKRIVAIALRENIASLRVMQKLGMGYEGDAVHHGFPVVLYAIQKQES